MLRKTLLLLALLLAVGCSGEQPAAQTTPGGAAPAAGQITPDSAKAYFLVFFLDPNGGPCRMQNSILAEMNAELTSKVTLRSVRTTVPAERNLFYTYGIRGLPTLLLTDADGNVVKRLPPGVQPAEAIRELLTAVPTN